MSGYLSITFGPMFSNKTSDLIQNIQNKHIISNIEGEPFKGIVINHISDVRDSTHKVQNLTTHNSCFSASPFPENVDFITAKKLKDISHLLDGYSHISIDEAQFFPDLVEVVLDLIENRGKDVHVVGLISDSDRKPFGDMWKLIPYADDVEQKKAFCVSCKSRIRNAPFTKKVGEEKKEGQICVGAIDDYVPCCRYHHR